MPERHPAVSANRRHLLRLLAGGGLALASVPGLIRSVLAAGTSPERRQGIYRLEGQVRFNGQARQVGDRLSLPLEVVSGDKSLAVFVIGEDAWLVRPNSRLTLTGKEKSPERVADIKLATGGLLSVFGKGEVALATRIAVAGVRGTGVYMESWEKRDYICLCYGWIQLQPTGRPDLVEKFRTTHHESPRFIYPDRMEPAPLINHTDDELILLEGLTGRVPPFYGQSDYGNDGILGDLRREQRYTPPK